MNDIKVGEKLYLYTARNGKFNIHEGEVVYSKYFYSKHLNVKFSDRTGREQCPNLAEIGLIQIGGPRLWLRERDDKKARELFLAYEREKLRELEKTVKNKKALIRVLEEGLAV